MCATATVPADEADFSALEAHLASWHRQIDAALDRLLTPGSPSDSPLQDAMRYAVLAGPGKRFRPLLCMLATEACGGEGRAALPTACAIELLHACSLVLDDLPSMDDGSLRRGFPSCHMQFGEATAILAAHSLLAMAFDLVARQGIPAGTANPPASSPVVPSIDHRPASTIRPDRALAVLTTLTRAIGPLGLAGGQAADLLAEGQTVDARTLESIHARKTGALIQAAVTSGALLAGADPGAVAALERYGTALGQTFQIVDDLLSETGDVVTLGKDPGSDRALGKATYPRLYGLEGARQAADDAFWRAVEALSDFDHRADPLRAMARFARGRQR